MQLIRALPYLIFHQFFTIYQSTKSKSATMVLAEPSCYFDKSFVFIEKQNRKSSDFPIVMLYYIFQIIYFTS